MPTGVELCVDGFPLDPGDPDCYIHRELGHWLQSGKTSHLPVALRLGPGEERWRWVRPVLTRFAWIRKQGELLPLREQWEWALAMLLERVLNVVRYLGHPAHLTEEMVIGLAREMANLGRARGWSGPMDALALIQVYAKGNPRSAALREALHDMLRGLAPEPEIHVTTGRELAWMLFLDEENPDDGAPCWSSAVRADLRSLKPAQRKNWIGLLKLAPTSCRTLSPSWEERVRKAVDRIGTEEVPSRIGRWCERFRQPEPVALEFAGAVLLRLLIEMTACGVSAGLIGPLASLAETQWDSKRSLALWKQILPRYTEVIFRDGEFRGTIVTLAAQPYSGEAPQVSAAMDELLQVEPTADAVGIDGFALQGDPLQARLDRYLRGGLGGQDPLIYLIPEQSETARRELLQALERRIEWVSGRIPKKIEGPKVYFVDSKPNPILEAAQNAHWSSQLERVRSSLVGGGMDLDVQELAALLRKGSWATYDRVVGYTARNGYQAELVTAVRDFYQTLHGSVADQTQRRHVGWWLWLEDVTPVDSKECWSSIIRADLRQFPERRRKAWRGLFENISFADTSKIPSKWIKAAQPLLAEVGESDFRANLRRWMEPFRETGQPLALTVPGRDALRLLIWYCSLCGPDPSIDEALAWIGLAKWKNRKSAELLGKIVGPLTGVLCSRSAERGWEALDGLVESGLIEMQYKEYARYRELSGILGKAAREGRSRPPSEDQGSTQNQLRQMLKISPGLDRVKIGEDHVLVGGDLDEYRVNFTGEVSRRNGQPVSMDWDRFPPQVKNIWQERIDASDIENGPFKVNLLQLACYVSLLARDRQFLGDAGE